MEERRDFFCLAWTGRVCVSGGEDGLGRQSEGKREEAERVAWLAVEPCLAG